MFGRLYHPLILRGECKKSCTCACLCLDGEKLSLLNSLHTKLLHHKMSKNGSNPARQGMTEHNPSARKNSATHDRLRCIFCRIVDGNEPNSSDKILFQDDEFVVFPDIRPASKHHLLVVTKEHIRDAKSITQVDFLERMVGTGRKVLNERIQAESQTAEAAPTVTEEDATSKALMGFHWPPFHSVTHLHLHVIFPPQEMGFIGRMIFRPNSYWFVQPSWVKERLAKSNPSVQAGTS